MREILFRGKRLDNGEWVEGDLRHGGYYRNDTDVYIVIRFADTVINCPVNPDTIGQFTGLYVIGSSKRIFEGDILRFSYTGTNKGVNGIAPVVFDNGKFGVRWGWHKELVALDGFTNTKIEVIGNIHDNPELLGERNCEQCG